MSSGPDGRLANLVGVLATGLADQITADTAAVSGLDETAAAALIALLDFAPSSPVQRLSIALGLSHSGTVRLVDRLADAGLVVRAAAADARAVTVHLTRTGRRRAERTRAARRAAVEAVLADVPAEQRRTLTRACEAMIATMTARRLAQRADGHTPPGGALCRLCDFDGCGRPIGRCPAARVTGAAG